MKESKKELNRKYYEQNKEALKLKRFGDMSKDPLYISGCSFGKDSVATVMLAMEHNEPLDRVAFCEVMYDHSRDISGEMPEHIAWIYNVAIPKFREWGLQVDVIRAEQDYVSLFNKTVRSGPNKGKVQGFPFMQGCYVEGYCKTKAIHRYYAELRKDRPLITYLGIAADEGRRLAGIEGSKTSISLLAKYNVTEAMAKEMCRSVGLLSPIYDVTIRTGCWFCPNRKIKDHARFASENEELWRELVQMGKTQNMAGYNFTIGETIEEIDKEVKMINSQLTLF